MVNNLYIYINLLIIKYMFPHEEQYLLSLILFAYL